MKIEITETKAPKRLPDEKKLGFGSVFTDHMFVMDYDDKNGWHNPRIEPFGNFSLSPAACVFHYGAEVFEGLKAYRALDGRVLLFRPEENARRLKSSCERIGLPVVPEESFLQAVDLLVGIDSRWVPSAPGTSLYIRPFVFATDPTFALHGVHEAVFAVVLAPSGSYYKNGIKPVSILLETEDVRAVRGGTGYAKCGGNYAASNRAGDKALAEGFSQVLWLDGVERKYVEEVGSMNVMFKIGGKVITPALTGSILPGITRKSCIELLTDWGYDVEERLVSMEELAAACEAGTLEEAWGTGTAAVISPIGELNYNGVSYVIGGNRIGPLSKRLYDGLTAIQWGRREDIHGWVKPLGSFCAVPENREEGADVPDSATAAEASEKPQAKKSGGRGQGSKPYKRNRSGKKSSYGRSR